jgi:hypothetical protein
MTQSDALDRVAQDFGHIVRGEPVDVVQPRSEHWAAPRFRVSTIGAISCCELPVQVLVMDFLRSPITER